MKKRIKKLLLVLLVFTVGYGYGQGYEETMDRCMGTLQSKIESQKMEELESKYVAYFGQFNACARGLIFPSFKATTIDHITCTPEDLKGKVVLINLWFIGCPPCVTEIPMLNELQNELGAKGFVILSFGRDDAQSIEEFRRENPMHFSVFANSKELMVNTFKMNFGFPTNVFLDRNGRIVELRTGGAMDEAGLRKTKEEFKTLIEDKLKK